MENLVIVGERGEYFIPSVSLDASSGKFEISGESYLEDTVKFYEPILNWMKQFTADVKSPIHLDIKLTYFNTSSSRSLLDIFYLLKEYENNGGEVKIDWYIKQFDYEMKEEIEDYMLDTELTINIVKTDKL
ncbi:MAG: DUF1987 domain-containing protein [Bacteroidales bacterium]|nr:DUF1987 domain-containing protein [Bacteroidales bacterium]